MALNRKYKILYKIKQLIDCNWLDLEKLSEEQVDYINHYVKTSSFLDACPGSGKTEVIGVKTAFEIAKWKSKNSGLAVVTFTTSAAKELNGRIKKFGAFSTESFPHFIGTFDSWVHNYILQPFLHYLIKYDGKNGDKSFRIIDSENSAGFLSNYITNIYKDNKSVPVKVTDYYYDYNGTLQATDEKKESLINASSTKEKGLLLENKKKFIKAGFVTYSDVNWLCKHLFNKFPFLVEKLAQRFSVIIVDECQDLSAGQIKILDSLRSKGSSLHFVGDLNQSIYEFRKVNPKDIADYINNSEFKLKKLTNNYRSCQSIVNLCQKLISNNTVITAYEKQICNASCLLWQYDEVNHLSKRFETFLLVNNLDIAKAAIVARGKTTLSSIRMQQEKYTYLKAQLFVLAIYHWNKDNRTTEDIQRALFYFGRVICFLAFNGQGDSRNQYCPDTFDVVEWRVFLKELLLNCASLYPYEENGQALTWEQWMPKLKAKLAILWPSIKSSFSTWQDVSLKIRTPDGEKKNAINRLCEEKQIKNLIRTTTIHSVKGETLSALLLISHPNKQSKGGHFSHWLREGSYDEEHIRFAYVAVSRPKYALILATPKLKTSELQKLQALGFVAEIIN